MLTSLPDLPRTRHRLPDPDDPSAQHPYRTAGAEVVTADGRSLPLVSARLRGSARGGIARLVLEQRFENRHAEALHVTYRMPLPPDGAVSGYAFDLGDRTIAGRVQRTHEARERFERAVAAGHTAALLEQDRADLFTQSIGNLPAHQALIARIAIDQRLIWLPEGEWELRFPTVIGPRYVAAGDRPEDVRGSRVATAPGGVAARIQIAIAIRDELAPGRRPGSPSHALTTGDGGVTELGDVAGTRLDRDLVLHWPVAGPVTGVSLAVTRPERSDDCYGLVTIVPPSPAARPRVLPRDLIVLIDTSGSMSGHPLDKAKQVIALLIESLGDGDRLELIEFSSEPRRYKPAPAPATRGEKQAAIRWLRGLSAGGGTEMRTAVIEALRALRPGAQRQVVLATDGYIGGEAAVVERLHADLPASCRLHFVGIGSAVNRSLATAMARAGRGAEVICDLDGDPERAARRLLDRTRSPVLTDITLDGSAVIARAPEAVPDVYAGSPVVAAVKLGAGELVVRGRTSDGDWERRLRVGMPRPGDGDPAIVALFGRERVADLEARSFAGEGCDAEIERLGVVFQIATRLTAFVAVDETRAVRPAVRHEAVPQEVPYGTTAAAFGLRPATAPLEVMELRLASRSTAGVTADEFSGTAFAVQDLAGLRFDDDEVRAFDGGVADETFDDVAIATSVAIDASDENLDDDFDLESSSLLAVPDAIEEDEREIVDPVLVLSGSAATLEGGALQDDEPAPAAPTEKATATSRPEAPPEPGNPRAERVARFRRAMKPRGVASISPGTPKPPAPVGGLPPEKWPVKTAMMGRSEDGSRPVAPASVADPKPAAPASVDNPEPVAPASVAQPTPMTSPSVERPRAVAPAQVAQRERVAPLDPMASRSWGEPAELGAPQPRRRWPVLLAILAVLAVLAALAWWLVR